MIGFLAFVLALQSPSAGAHPARAVAASSTPTGAAVRAVSAPRAPGIHDRFWDGVPPIREFTEYKPKAGAPLPEAFRTEARIAYDSQNLYVLVRCFDPHPDSIRAILARRDTPTASDYVSVYLDSYHYGRTGRVFSVNPASVQIDAAVKESAEDPAWDGVWDAEGRKEDGGWTAWFEIPFSQLEYNPGRSHTFGLLLLRYVQRTDETQTWPRVPAEAVSLLSRAADLTGLENLMARQAEATHDLVAKNEPQPTDHGIRHPFDGTVGLALKLHVGSIFTVDATENPDFGQVESDPAVMNLSGYQTFYVEQRPYFVAARGLFSFQVDSNAFDDGSEGLYYSRRIGRTPQLGAATQQPTTILVASQASFQSRWLTGAASYARTDRASEGDSTTEPATDYAVARLQLDPSHKQWHATLAVTGTLVNRTQDRFTSPYLAGNALAGGVIARQPFTIRGEPFEFSIASAWSRVTGSPTAIDSLQRSAVHNYQRPDGALRVDSSLTALTGDAEEISVAKVGSPPFIAKVAWQRRSPGFEVNDLGFLSRADQQTWTAMARYTHNGDSTNAIHEWDASAGYQQRETSAGLTQDRLLSVSGGWTHASRWSVRVGTMFGQMGTTYDDFATRGGPAVRQDPYVEPWVQISGDERSDWVPTLYWLYEAGDAGHTWRLAVTPTITWQPQGRVNLTLSLRWMRNSVDPWWYRDTTIAGVTQYLFARLDQTEASVTARLNYTFNPKWSLQFYAQPFISEGTYSDVRQLTATPRAARYDDRYAAYPTNDPGGTNLKAWQSNVVLRWEWLRGSTLFVVWDLGYEGRTSLAESDDWGRHLADLLGLRPSNSFLVKFSWWADL